MSFERGLHYHQQGSLRLAIEQYQLAMKTHPRPETAYNLGLALMGAGEWQEAEDAYLHALRLRPNYPAATNNLALALQKQGRLFAAEKVLRDFLCVDIENHDAHINLGGLLYEQGRPNEAAEVLYRTLKIQSFHPVGWYLLGLSLREVGSFPEATGCLFRSHQQDPSRAETLLELASVLYADQGRCLHCLETAHFKQPNHHYVAFQLAVFYHVMGREDDAENIFSKLPAEQCQPWLDSWKYVGHHLDRKTRFFGSQAALIEYAVQKAENQGMVLELGVRFGTSIRLLQQFSQSTVYGFDSFQGLPLDWHEVPKGAYSTGGQVPDLGPHVQLFAGWFNDTLPGFLAEHEQPIRLLHIDCDLYESTEQALTCLGPRLKPGSIILFDEYLMNGQWHQDEFRAWQECVARNNWSYEYLAFGMHSHQALVRLL